MGASIVAESGPWKRQTGTILGFSCLRAVGRSLRVGESGRLSPKVRESRDAAEICTQSWLSLTFGEARHGAPSRKEHPTERGHKGPSVTPMSASVATRRSESTL